VEPWRHGAFTVPVGWRRRTGMEEGPRGTMPPYPPVTGSAPPSPAQSLRRATGRVEGRSSRRVAGSADARAVRALYAARRLKMGSGRAGGRRVGLGLRLWEAAGREVEDGRTEAGSGPTFFFFLQFSLFGFYFHKLGVCPYVATRDKIV
jgi:hypothetical protein